MKAICILLIPLLVASCSNIPSPSLLSPSENKNLIKVNYGNEPNNFQKILKDYLISNLTNYKTAKVEFINQPSKISINHLGDTYSGYRACLSINIKRGDYYMGYKNHFFLINDNNVILHLYDSGLLTIPFEYCVTRSKAKEIYIEDIPEETFIDNIPDIPAQKIEQDNIADNKDIESVKNNVYILCSLLNNENTYVFNEHKNTFNLIDGETVKEYRVSFNDAFINATNNYESLKINRVSGKIIIESNNKNEVLGKCTLFDKTKF